MATNTATKSAANRKARRAANKRGAAQPAKSQTETQTTTQPVDTAQTAAERVAKIGDNQRAFYTAVNALVTDLRKINIDHTQKSDSVSFDWTVRMYEMRDIVSLELFCKGNATQSANDVRNNWLRMYVPAYEQADIAARATIGAMTDYYRHQAAINTRDSNKAAAESIRVMFERVCLAAYWLQHVQASDIAAAKKGKSRAVTFQYPNPDAGKADDKGKPQSATLHSTLSVSALTANGRIVVAAAREKEGKAPTGQSKKRGGKSGKAAAAAPQSAPTIVQTADSITKELTSLRGEAIEKTTTNPAIEAMLVTTIATRFGKRNKSGVLTAIDVGAFLTWFRTTSFVQSGHLELIGLPSSDTPKADDKPAATGTTGK